MDEKTGIKIPKLKTDIENGTNIIFPFLDIVPNLIKAYIESDSDKSQYILEEFSDNDAINEYLVFCPVETLRPLQHR